MRPASPQRLPAAGAGTLLAALAALALGAPEGLSLLAVARALTGLGAALATPAALALISELFDEGSERNRALGYMSASIDVGMVVGAVLGGLITSLLGWRWVFYVVAVGVAALALTPQAVPEGRATQAIGSLNGSAALAGAAAGAALLPRDR